MYPQTVGDLRAMLEDKENIPDEMPLHIAYDYGDHWHSRVAPNAQSCEVQEIKYSDYHRMPKLIDEDSERDEDMEEENPEDDKTEQQRNQEFRSGQTKRKAFVISVF